MAIRVRGVSAILNRDLSAAASHEIRDVGRPLLQTIVDEGIRIFERCNATARGHDEHAGLLFPYLRTIQLLDGVEVALDGSSGTAAAVLLRSAFEGLMAVEWVARDTSLRYGAAYVVAHANRRILDLSRFQRGHHAHAELSAAIAADEYGRRVRLPEEPDIQRRIQSLEMLLKKPWLTEAQAEYTRLRATRRGQVPFFSLWNGPTSLEQVARALGFAGHYALYYRAWARAAHVEDAVELLGTADGQRAIRVFRATDDIQQGYGMGAYFGLRAMRTLLGVYRQEELDSGFRIWFARDVQERYHQIAVSLNDSSANGPR